MSVIKFQLNRIKSNLFVFFLVVLSGLSVIYVGFKHDTLKQAFVYLSAMWFFAFCTDFYVLKRPAKHDFPVKNARLETIYFLLCFCLGLVFFYVRFSGAVDWQNLKPIIKLATLPLIIFVFPIGLAIIMLLLKYNPKTLGLRLQGFWTVIPIILVSLVLNRIVAPENLTWQAVMQEEGSLVGLIFSGLIVSGLSEEFFRVIGQTRIGAFVGNKGLGWFVCTFLWAFLHAPKWYADDHNIEEAILGSLRIIPIGLMWGYITHRTKSFLPASLVHGSNFWGLQNF